MSGPHGTVYQQVTAVQTVPRQTCVNRAQADTAHDRWGTAATARPAIRGDNSKGQE